MDNYDVFEIIEQISNTENSKWTKEEIQGWLTILMKEIMELKKSYPVLTFNLTRIGMDSMFDYFNNNSNLDSPIFPEYFIDFENSMYSKYGHTDKTSFLAKKIYRLMEIFGSRITLPMELLNGVETDDVSKFAKMIKFNVEPEIVLKKFEALKKYGYVFTNYNGILIQLTLETNGKDKSEVLEEIKKKMEYYSKIRAKVMFLRKYIGILVGEREQCLKRELLKK